MLFNLAFDPLTHGVIWSLLVNSAVYIAVSLFRAPSPIERMQAAVFVTRDIPLGTAPGFRLWRTAVTVGEVEATVARYLGTERTSRAFAEAATQRKVAHDPKVEADIRMLRFAEHLLASAVGTASSRLVMALLLERHSKNPRGAMKLLDDASTAIQYNRDLLQSAIDNVGQGIAVFDSEGKLICWNERFCSLLALPADMSRIGAPLEDGDRVARLSESLTRFFLRDPGYRDEILGAFDEVSAYASELLERRSRNPADDFLSGQSGTVSFTR